MSPSAAAMQSLYGGRDEFLLAAALSMLQRPAFLRGSWSIHALLLAAQAVGAKRALTPYLQVV